MILKYIRWLYYRGRSPYRNTPLLGNPNEVVGLAPQPRRQTPAVARAFFGKYEQRKRRRRTLFVVIGLLCVSFLAWIIWESVQGLGLFQN